MLRHSDGRIFASSSTSYLDTFGNHEQNKIFIQVRFAECQRTFAVVDTAAPWCVLSKQEATFINPNYRNESVEDTKLIIRGDKFSGVLVRWPVTLCAEKGLDITIEGTIFVPDDDLLLPNFIGLDGLLARINFAVESQRSLFFFGLESN